MKTLMLITILTLLISCGKKDEAVTTDPECKALTSVWSSPNVIMSLATIEFDPNTHPQTWGYIYDANGDEVACWYEMTSTRESNTDTGTFLLNAVTGSTWLCASYNGTYSYQRDCQVLTVCKSGECEPLE